MLEVQEFQEGLLYVFDGSRYLLEVSPPTPLCRTSLDWEHPDNKRGEL